MKLQKKQQQFPTKYETVIGSNFHKREKELIVQLSEQAQLLKQQLSFFKREASHENIEKMIGDRRRQKERERQLLEGRWRECNQSFKAMHQEQKRLTNEQKERIFDIKNLQNKIQEFKTQMEHIETRIENKALTNHEFVTEVKEDYESPYKMHSTVQQKIIDRIKLEQSLLAKTQPYFFANKYKLNSGQVSREGSQHNLRNVSSVESPCRMLKVVAEHQNTGSVQRGKGRQDASSKEGGGLREFLSNKDVRLKLFRLLKKQQ